MAGTERQILYDSTGLMYVKQANTQKLEIEINKPRGKREGGLWLNRYRGFIGSDESDLDVDGVDRYTALWV